MIEALALAAVPNDENGVGGILAVGSRAEWERNTWYDSEPQSFVFVAFGDIDGDLLDRLSPSAILSPAVAWDFDCIDLAVLLEKLNYAGKYRATARDLPKPQLIESEISQLCPKLDFGIIQGV